MDAPGRIRRTCCQLSRRVCAQLTGGFFAGDPVEESLQSLPLLLCRTENSPSALSFLAQEECMPKFVIEREIPGAGKMSDAEIQAVSQKS